MLKVSEADEKITPAKRTITIKNVSLQDLKIVDETGDITEEVLDNIPEGYETTDIKMSFEILNGEDE